MDQKPVEPQTSTLGADAGVAEPATDAHVEVLSDFSDTDGYSDDLLTSSRSETGMCHHTSTPEVTLHPKPKAGSSLLRIKAQLRMAAEANLETSVKQADEPVEQEKADLSAVSAMSEEQEESRNLNREIRESVNSGIHGLYEMVLRLDDSRSRHIADKEKARANYEHQLVRLQSRNSAALELMLRSHQEAQQKLLEEVKNTYREAESARWLVYEMEAQSKEQTKSLEKR
ncbi:jg7111 [Pararge aegeria aegeria]|uniref:Jg7111 protein n=1 Tax=Pararge aegeria aegeria TaxID=348720 RepID=A0A8S4QJP1_9NEOP|nr:jg7111 [Pararge aegeria aegeria]